MTTEIRQELTALFGESAPAAPQTREALMNLPFEQRATIERALPEFYESLAARPDELPAAVSLRLDRGQLTMTDIPMLMSVGMPATANKVQLQAMNASVTQMQQELAEKKAQREANQAQEEARLKRVSDFSRRGGVGRYEG